MTKRLARWLVCCALVSVALPLGAPSRSAAVVSCNSPITRSTTLTADLGPCNSNGLNVTGSGLTLDLGGNTIIGPGFAAFTGIQMNSGSRVTIRNGTVQGFGTGLHLAGSHITLSNLKVISNGNNGVEWLASSGVVERLRSVGNGSVGIAVGLPSSTASVFSRNSFVGNGNGAVIDAPARFTSNYFTSNAGRGAILNTTADGAIFRSNFFNGNADDGIIFGGADDVLFASNIANYNGDLGVEGNITVIDDGRNLAKGNVNPKECSDVSCN